MRIFYALTFSEETKSIIKEKTNMIHDYLAAGRGIDLHNLHITIQFIGEIEKSLLPKYIEVLKNAVGGSIPLSVEVSKINSFYRKAAHIIYLQFKKDIGLLHIRKNVIDGLELDNGKYLPHITLFRDAVFKKGFSIKDISDIISPMGFECPVSGIELMESRQINGKLTYLTLYSIKKLEREHGS